MTTGINRPSEHRWGPPMPGQGRDHVCTRCGSRRSTAPEHCVGEEVETFTGEVTQHDYDPLEADD